MLVLGLDPGLALTGWALVDGGGGGRLRLRGSGCLTTSSQLGEPQRLLALSQQAEELLAMAGAEVVAVEKLFFQRNVSTAMAVSQARGVLLCAAARRGLPVAEYTPGEVKRAVTGSGSADKRQVARMVQLILGAKVPTTPDDVTDACAVGICHQHASGLRVALAASRA
ncbi:MAG: crossover junction endodeoxyribonuclease RuvC [Candidatus Dormibacteria bacterium]